MNMNRDKSIGPTSSNSQVAMVTEMNTAISKAYNVALLKMVISHPDRLRNGCHDENEEQHTLMITSK